ncbi:MAG: hypothetical protein R3D57_00010 [Hyphomicrobiaceae bacterium]
MYRRPRSSSSPWAKGALAAVLLLVAGCASGPRPSLEPGSSVLEARQLLVDTAAEGPVRVTWTGDPPLSEPSLLAAVERGVTGLRVATTTAGTAERRFDFRFDSTGPAVCGDAAFASTTPGQVQAAFCDGDRAVSVASVEMTGDTDPVRAIWQLVGRIVPDDYEDTYGFGWFGNTFSIGVGAGSSSGVGGGIGVGF